MRNLLFILLIIPFFGFGQLSFSCEGIDHETWDHDTRTWNHMGDFDKDAASLFVINDDQTMIYHTNLLLNII